MLQLVCALKSLQLNGIERISNDFSEFFRYSETDSANGCMDQFPRILLLQESLRTSNKEAAIIGLCDYAINALITMLNINKCDLLTKLTRPLQSSSLTDAKNALEFGMFVGKDAITLYDEESAQAWIDSQRAEYFREVFECSCQLNEVYERLHLQFLLSVTSQTLLQMFQTVCPNSET
ncbi:unnamed protein product [Thelazia callipaeda]|uniref:WASH-7_N domain-containing protein n=1 Tax=Thelazia callipaeda TaxID=103827 RepID=A0A0N5D792_THECL|nr:unnamed protein product [Thelazia callipaeda]